MKDYAHFVKKYHYAIDYYANIDVIPNPDLTWRNQQILENEYGLHPVPVVHYRTDLKWLAKYMELGYEYIGLGGLVGSTSQDACQGWIDRCFEMVCDQPSRLPKVGLHGFGITAYGLLLRYPWRSVDSTSWTKIGAFGGILVPRKRGKKFVFQDEQGHPVEPYLIKVSMESPDASKRQHALNLSKAEKAIIQEWLDLIGVPLGKMDSDGNVLEFGVVTRHTERRAANLLFFEKLRESLPEYPWAWSSKRRKGLGLI